jgi:hypothetical protein
MTGNCCNAVFACAHHVLAILWAGRETPLVVVAEPVPRCRRSS